MKKILVLVLAVVMLLTATTGAAFGAEANPIKEVPDIKVVMDGALTSYKNVPISVNGSNLLPLREMLVNLGVPNDDEHIIYKSEEKSVTIIYGQTTILLKIGDTTAYVNDNPLTLNAAPVLYKNSTYIPVRFVAEALGKKVVWDGKTRTVLVCNQAKFDSIQQLLKKSNEAAEKVDKYKMAMDVTAVSGSDSMKFTISMKADAAVDKSGKKMYTEMLINMLGMELNIDSYYADNKSYSFNPFIDQWEMKTYAAKEYDEMFESQTNASSIKAQDALCAGLVQQENADNNEIILNGDVYLADLFDQAMEQQGSILGSDPDEADEAPIFEKFNIRMILERDTYLIKSIVMKASTVEYSDGQKITTEAAASISFSDYNGNINIIVPEEVIQKAVEAKPDGSGSESKF